MDSSGSGDLAYPSPHKYNKMHRQEGDTAFFLYKYILYWSAIRRIEWL